MITIRGINGDILTHFDNDVPNGNPYFEPVLTDDMESLVSSFSFSVPLELADTEHLVGLNQVLVKDRQGDLRLFVITDVHEVWTTVGGTLQVNCEDISINEMNNIIVSPFESLNFQDTLTKTFKDSGWTLKYGANWKDVDNTTFKVENYDNMRSVIASIVDTYGCQFKFMAQENQFGEITRVAEVYKSRGNDTGKYFYYDRDLLGIERDINHADIKTAIHPYYTGYDGKTYSLKGFAPANPDPDFKKDKASPLIINREASKLFDDGNSYRIMPYKTEVEGNPELVYREAIKELKKYAEPIYTYSVNVLLLQNMIGWEGEGIDLGDTVWMKERVGNRELGLEARVTAYEYHEDDPSKDVVTFSNFKEIDTTDVPELAERIFIAYANSEDGIIDFSITDSVGKAYMGVYTAAVSTQSTDPSTYSWTRIKGEDGVSAPTLNLTSSQQVMKFNSNGTPDGDQTIIFTALKQNSTETVTWEAIPYKGDIAQPTITLGGTGDVRSLSSANWNNEWTRVKVTVSMGSLKDIQTVVMVSDGATGASGKAIVGYVTNESTTFAASSDGTVTDYGNGGGKFVLYEGTNKVTSGVTFARVSQVGINLLINDTTGEYKVSNMTTDMAQASVSATYKGITITKFLSFSKSKQGVKGDKGDTGNDGIAGKDGIGLKSTTVTYAASASGTTAPSTGWQEQVPTVAPNNFLWTRTVWTYTDDTSETGYSVAKMGRDGAKGNDGIAGKDGVGIAKTLIEYAVSASGTTKPTSGWSTSIPTTPQGQYLWTRTTWTYTDETTEQGFTVARMGQDGARGNDGIAGKDGVGLKSTDITYAGSASGTTPPSTGWQAQVPTVPAGQYLWTKTVWTYTDNSNETGYSVARMGQNGNNGKDGIAGKDGVGINNTLVEYAVSTSGTTKPTSGWSTSIPTVPQGQYLWTRTTWTYTDNTTEQGFTVARQGEKGDKGDKGDQGIAGPKGADGKTQYTHIAYADNASGGGFSQSPTGKAYIGMYVDFEELDSSDPTKYAWSLIKGADGEQGVAGPKGEDGRTPYFHTAYINNTDFGAYDYSGNPNLMANINANNFSQGTGVLSVVDDGDEIVFTLDPNNKLDSFKAESQPALLVGKTYTMSAEIMLENDFTGDPSKISLRYIKMPNWLSALTTRFTLTNDKGVWQKITVTDTMTTAINNAESWFIMLHNRDVNNKLSGKVRLRNIKIEEGSTATPYQPNLLDEPYYLSKAALGKNIADPTKTFPITSSETKLYTCEMTEPFVIGETYTITLKGTKPADKKFRVYNEGVSGYAHLSPVEGLTDVWSATFTVNELGPVHTRLNILQVPTDNPGNCTIDWLKIEKGDTRTPNIDSYKYLGNYTDFEQADSLNPTKYAWNLIKGETPRFHTAYTDSTDFGSYDYSGNPNLMVPLKASDFYPQSGATIEDYRDALKVTFTKTDGAVFLGTSTNIPALLPNTQYTLSADVTVSEGYTGKLENLRLGYRKSPNGTIILPLTAKDAVVGQKTRISITANSSAATDSSKFDRMYFTINTTSTEPFVGTVLVENIKVERGTTATPYQPNLLDAPWYFSTVPLGENMRKLDEGKQPPYTTTDYMCYVGRIKGLWEADETYTVTINATKPATQTFGLYLLNGSQPAGNLTPVEGLTDTWSVTFKVTKEMINVGVTNHANIFQVPQSTKGEVKINWVKIEKGSVPTPNIDNYNYLGNYTDFVQADSLNPTKYSWSLIKGADGQDGKDGAHAKALTLQADSPVMKFDANDVVVAGQVITFTAFKQNFDSNIAWVATPYKGNTAQPAIALKGTGDVRTLEASMWASGVTTIRVDVSADTFRDSVTITKVKDGAKGDRGNDGIAGKDGVGIRSTAITYAGSASGTTPPATGWQTQVPTVPAGQFLWTKTVWTYTDNSTETGYSAAMMGKDGAKGNDGIAGKDGVGIKTTVIEYAVNTSGTVKPTSGWTSAVPNTPAGQYLWTRTTWTYTDNTTEQGFTVARQGANGATGKDGIAGKDGVGLRSTSITYAGSTSGTTAPSTGWNTQVPTVPAGQFLWTKTVWTYTDASSETGYSVAKMGQDGAKGNDGIAGKDGVGIKTTLVEYAANTSGTVKPTSGWSTSIPNTPAGQYLWTRTTWTYTDNTTEQGYTVARQGANGTNGTNGTNGIDAYSAILSNEANTFAANPAGAVTDWSTGRGTFMVYKGTTRLTSGVTYAVASSVDASGTINATTGDYSVTALAKDNGSITFKATIGSTVLTKTMTLSKARQGAQGVQGTMGIAFYSPTEPTGANVKEGSTWFKTVSTADNTIAGIYTYKGGKWVKTEVASGALSVEKLSALSADLGDVTAGNITGVNITGASFVNPFDFTDVTMNHFKGTTEIADAEIGLEGIVNEGTAGARKFVNSITPAYFQSVHKDASGSILRSVNTSSSGIILNDSNVTTSFDKDGLRVVDMPRNASSWSMSTRIGLTRGSDGSTMEIHPDGPVLNNRKNIHVWQGTGTNLKAMPNLGRITFGTYQSIGWGMINDDIPLKVHNSYTWQAKRKIKLELIAQINVQDASGDWVYFTAQSGMTTSTDTSPRQTITIGRISATKDSGDNRIPLQNTVLCTGYFELNEGEYLSICGNCRTTANCGNVTGMSIAFREIFST